MPLDAAAGLEPSPWHHGNSNIRNNRVLVSGVLMPCACQFCKRLLDVKVDVMATLPTTGQHVPRTVLKDAAATAARASQTCHPRMPGKMHIKRLPYLWNDA